MRDTAASPQPEHQAVSNRFSRWAQTILGSEGVETPQTIQPIPVTAGLGDLEILPDEKDMIMAADPDPDIVMMAEKAMAERRAAKWAARWAKNKKRRTDDNDEGSIEEDLLDKGAHEHPSRVARRKKLTATQKVDDEARKKMMEKKKQAKNGVFERIARAFNAAAPSSPSVNAELTQGENWKTNGAESKHILDTWGASHPELLDMDGGYAGF